MRILLSSDFHGLLDAFLRFSRALIDYDVGVIAGDLLDEDEASEKKLTIVDQEREIKDILKSARKPVLVVPGNHDRTALATDDTFINIHMSRVEIKGQPFVGYGCISRVLGPDLQMALLNEVEGLIDQRAILVTHIPPFGTLDLKSDNGGQMVSFGSRVLADAVSARKPRFHFFGDAHDSVGVKGNSINASYPLVSCFCGIDIDSGKVWTERGE